MIEKSYDPSEYIKGLQQILISDKKKIGFLFGAGTSVNPLSNNKDETVIPETKEITAKAVEYASRRDKRFEKALSQIKDELKKAQKPLDIESILSNLEQKVEIIGNGTLNDLNKIDFENLIKELKASINETVSVHEKLRESLCNLVHADFAEWIGQVYRHYPIEIFTTNYDYLFELGLESKNVPYYDGFTGSYEPFFNADSIEDLRFLSNQTKLWKIHGSLGWHFDKETSKILRQHSADERQILIYPSTLKYNESKKQPYVSLMDRLTNFLKQDDSILITCGYSFNDEHINERILSALRLKSASHVIALYFDDMDDNEDSQPHLYKIAIANSKISAYCKRSAIVGCKLGKWKLRREPDKTDTPNINLYYDEDAPSFSENDKMKVEKKGEEVWTGKGDFLLARFSYLIDFLKAMHVENKHLKDEEK